MTQHIYTVSEITKNIRSVLEGAFGAVWVEGEVSNFISHQSGHMYFDIKDEGGVLRCTLFRGVNVTVFILRTPASRSSSLTMLAIFSPYMVTVCRYSSATGFGFSPSSSIVI